jgi:hypothetical protein
VIAATFSEKEALFKEQAFPQALKQDPIEALQEDFRRAPLTPGIAHELVCEAAVKEALFSQGIEKALGTDLLNFQAIRLLWRFDQARIIALVR